MSAFLVILFTLFFRSYHSTFVVYNLSVAVVKLPMLYAYCKSTNFRRIPVFIFGYFGLILCLCGRKFVAAEI